MEGSGIINLLKPAGMTSHDCVDFMRRLTGVRRIGHSGTLDPMATGVLVVCIGKATRIIEYLESDDKQYIGEMALGLTTTTQDIWGDVVEDKRGEPGFDKMLPESLEDINKVFKGFEGDILQEAPGYSAVRIQGKRLYEYVRQGEVAPKPKRPVSIYRLDGVDYKKDQGRVSFFLACSKGTYVRTICQETGDLLGTGGAMSFLLRVGSGMFKSSDAVTLEELKEGYEKYLLPADYPLGHFGRLDLTKDRADDFCNGKILRERGVTIARLPSDDSHNYCVYYNDEFLGITKKVEGKNFYKAEKVLCQ